MARLNLPARASLAAAIIAVASLAGPSPAQVLEDRADAPALLDLGRQMIIPQSTTIALRPQPDRIAIESVAAGVQILELTATTTLDIALRNPSPQQAEAVLLLPVPEGAVVSSFLFEGAASEPTARVLPREEARRLYESIVAKVRDPALLEFAGFNLVRSSVFPVAGHGTQKVRIVYDHLLESDGQRVDYVLPRSESLERRVPWKVTASLRSAHPISTVYSPSHEILAERRSAGEFAVRLSSTATPEPGPFRLSYLLERDGVSASVFAYPDPEVGGGYFMLMAGLPANTGDLAARIRREVSVVIDRSGSMAGSKMDQVRAAALQVIEGLADGEAFNIIDYGTTVSSFAPAPLVKDAGSTLEARRYLESIRPGGGTNIHDALLEALRQKPLDGMLPIVLFLTDGLPTIGITRETDIRKLVETGNAHGRRVFTFGVGEDVNVPLLDRVAGTTRGTSTYVLPGADVEVEVARVFRQLYGPVLAEPVLSTIDSSGQITSRLVQEIIPAALPDLFEGDRLIVLGQYRSEEAARFVIAGNYLGERRTFEFQFKPAEASTKYAFVPRLWASRRIAFLIDEIRQAGAELSGRPTVVGESLLTQSRFREIIDEIVRLSTRFGILTEYTSFLATEGTNLSNWNELALGCSRILDERAVRVRAGLGAINQAMNYQAQAGQMVLNPLNRFYDQNLQSVEIGGPQQVCDLAFFRREGCWVDSRLAAGGQGPQPPDRTVEVGSAEHLALVRILLARDRQGALSLPGDILLAIDGETILVTSRSAQ